MLQLRPSNARTTGEIEAMRRAGAAAAECLHAALDAVQPGVRTADINDLVEARMQVIGATPLFRGYTQGSLPPFPAVCCVSINDEVVHGVPGERIIQPGDLVSVDVGLRLDGWCADNARSIVAEARADTTSAQRTSVTPASVVRRRRRLIEHTRATLMRCIDAMSPGVPWSTVAREAEAYARKHELGIVTEFVGHGIGRDLHEPPKAPCFITGYTGDDFVLTPGMVLAVEPILTLDPPRAWLPGNPPGPANRSRVRLDGSGWSVRTATGVDACHEEHTVLVTEQGAEALTARSAARG